MLQHELLWPDTIMSLVNNNIIIVSTRLIMCQLDWWKHKHAQLLLAKQSVIISLVLSNHQQYSYWNISLFYYSMSGHQICVWAQTYSFLPRHDCDHTIITCQGTNVIGHKRAWAQMCLGANVCGHKRVWAQSCGLKYIWAQMCYYFNLAMPIIMHNYRCDSKKNIYQSLP